MKTTIILQEGEIFRDIPVAGFENYQISNQGRLLNIRTSHILFDKYDKDGYVIATVILSSGVQKEVKVHRLVGFAWVPNPFNKPQINHLNGIKDDNRAENIEWSTCKENMQHAANNGLTAKGSKHGMSKLTEDMIPLIRQGFKDNLTAKAIAEDFGVEKATIYAIKWGKRWNHVPQLND